MISRLGMVYFSSEKCTEMCIFPTFYCDERLEKLNSGTCLVHFFVVWKFRECYNLDFSGTKWNFLGGSSFFFSFPDSLFPEPERILAILFSKLSFTFASKFSISLRLKSIQSSIQQKHWRWISKYTLRSTCKFHTTTSELAYLLDHIFHPGPNSKIIKFDFGHLVCTDDWFCRFLQSCQVICRSYIFVVLLPNFYLMDLF